MFRFRHFDQVGLDKIVSTQEQVGVLQEQLTTMEPVLIQTQVEVEAMIVTIVKDKEEASKTQNEVRRPAERLMTSNIRGMTMHG